MAAINPMYSLKPMTSTDAIAPTDVMYSLKSFHEAEAGGFTQEIDALEKRQENILVQLRKLKSEVDGLVNTNGKPSGAGGILWETQVKPCPSFSKGDVAQDIVISANPQSPPLSLFILHNQLAKQYSIFSSCFTHSSVLQVDEKLKSALGQCNGIARNSADIVVSLIWKGDVSRPTLSTSLTTIEGEAVIARYLARLMKPSYEADNLAAVTESDFLLDLASDLISGDFKAKENVINVLSKKLSTSAFLGGSSASVADMVLWSAVQQAKPTNISSSVKTWMQCCTKLPEFQSAAKLL